jgi:maleylpyruvate isomerase
VPVLEIHTHNQVDVLTQSMAMVDWLDHLKPTPLLFPTDPWQRAQVIQRAEIINSGIQPLQNLSVLQWVEKRYQGDKLEWGAKYIQSGLNALETLCSNEHSLFLVGDTPSMADLCLIPQLYNARRFKIDLAQFPRLCAVETQCEALDAFKQAHPNQQSDAQV